MKIFLVLLFFAVVHTFPLWNFNERLAGGLGDPLAHAEIGDWFCHNIVTGKTFTDRFQAPFGVDISGNYDSPFPYIVTCPFTNFGSIFQFHLFTMIQVLLIVISSFLLARLFIKDNILKLAYVLFAWWTGFYICKSHQHLTLLSQIWGTQFILFAMLSANFRSLKSMLISGALVGLSFIGTFQNIPGLFILTLTLALYRLINGKAVNDWITFRNSGLSLVIALGLFVLAWFPMIKFHLSQEIALLIPKGFREIYSLHWKDLVIPYKDHIFSYLFESKELDTESITLDFVIIAALLFFVCTKQFWRHRLSVVLLLFAVIHFAIALGPAFGFNDSIFKIFPFYLTRVPSRFAIGGYLSLILIVFIHFDLLENLKLKKYLSYFLVVTILVTGPLLNQKLFFPTLAYKEYIPTAGLKEFASLPMDQIVVNIPSAWAGDQTQNFLQIFHHKRITSGYLAYPVYTAELYKKVAADPFLGFTNCANQPLQFIPNQLHTDFTQLKKYLVTNNLTLFVFNKNLLFGQPSCKALTEWVITLAKQPWMKVVEENPSFLLTRVIK